MIKEICNLDETIAKDLIESYDNIEDIIKNLSEFILKLGDTLSEGYTQTGNVWIAKDANVSNKSTIVGPCIIDHKAIIRPNAYIRGNVIIGKSCVVNGEVKNSILFNNSKAPHFNYVGDSILGYNVNMGAGSITANQKLDKSIKIGSVIGDNASIGCNCVLNPGCIVGKNTIIYPLNSLRGNIPSDSIYKSSNEIVKIKESI